VAVASARTVSWLVAAALTGPLVGCTTIDPGNNYSLATDTFDSDYFYCHVEPEFIFQQNCGPGDPSAFPSDTGSCHFSAAVSGMNLQAHAAIDCGGGDHPTITGLASTGTGSAAASNYAAVSFEMNRDYTMAPLWLRPTGQIAHPRTIFPESDMTVRQLLSTWASK
jgi:hypothetical protein